MLAVLAICHTVTLIESEEEIRSWTEAESQVSHNRDLAGTKHCSRSGFDRSWFLGDRPVSRLWWKACSSGGVDGTGSTT